jgi:serine/threonine protein kinase
MSYGLEDSAIFGFVQNREDYTPLRVLGKGASGVVRLYKSKTDDELVAIKELHEIGEYNDQKSFIREVAILAQLKHPLLVNFYGFCLPGAVNADGSPFSDEPGMIILEFMRNGTLQDVLDKRDKREPTPQFGPTEKSKLVFGIAAGMAILHRAATIHRDLKPGNVFLDDNFEPRIADFGLSRLTENNSSMTLGIGSPLFMPPELYNEGPDPYTKAIDVYAYGILLYHLYTSEIVLDDGSAIRSPQQLLMRFAKGSRLKRLPEISTTMWDLISGCWEAVASKRPTFDAIVTKLQSCHDFCFPGTDIPKYQEYESRIAESMKSKTVGNYRRVEAAGHPLTVTELAKMGDPLCVAQRDKCMIGSKPARKFDFSRIAKKNG